MFSELFSKEGFLSNELYLNSFIFQPLRKDIIYLWSNCTIKKIAIIIYLFIFEKLR